ncbi:TonB-dependent receptor [Methylophaga sp.]|uniref:TonB-dependent receptor n=1 Tax=Methylophaga sp. TaxID=2024840 RepID=UPI003F6A376B
MFQKKQSVLLVSAFVSTLPIASLQADEVIEIPSLTVTADPLGARSPDELIFPVSVLADKELDKQRAGTLGETLDGLPGVANSDFGPGVGRPVVRGLQGSRVQVLEDGLKTVDVSGEGGDHTVAIDPGRAEQIEVFRGPATLLYGSGAAGGVINVKSGRFNPEFGEAPRVHGQAGYGYNGDERQGNIGLELPLSENFVLRTDYGLRRSHDFDIDGFQQKRQTKGDKDTLQNSAAASDSFSLTGVFKGDWGHAGLGYSRWRTEYGIPEVMLGESEEEQETIRADFDRVDFRSEFNNPLPGFRTARLKLSHTNFNQQEIGSHFHDGVLEESEVETSFANDESEARLELVHNPIGLWQGVLGLQLNNREFGAEGEGHGDHAHEGDGFYIRDNDTRSTGLFVLEERLTDFGRLEFAARIDHVRSDPRSLAEERHIDLPSGDELHQEANLGSRSYTPLSLSAGSIIDIDDKHHLRMAITRSERAPSPEQLYAFGNHAASGTVEVGDASLDEETYTNFEIGLDRHSGPFRFDATLFYNHVQDFIYLASVDDGSGSPIMIDGDTLVFNQQNDARFYGAELTAAWDVKEGVLPLTLRLSGDYVRAKLNNGDNLPRISPARVGMGVDTVYRDWSLSVDYRHVFRQSDSASLETDTSGYDLLSFNASWQPASLKGAEVYVQGHNLLNEDGRRHQSFLKDEAPIIGRTVMTGIRFDFGG